MLKKRQILAFVFMAASVILLLVLVLQLLPLIEEVIADGYNEANIVAYVDAHGASGVPILMGLSALQVIIPFIPGPAVGVLSGLCYGILWGPLIYVAGFALGNLFIFVSVRQLRGMFIPQLNHDHKQRKFLTKEQLARIKRPELVAFFCVLIPGLPNVLLPYIFAASKVSLLKYMLAVIAGLTPSAFLYAFAGNRLSQGSYTAAIVIAAIVVVIILILIPFRKKIMDKILLASDA